MKSDLNPFTHSVSRASPTSGAPWSSAAVRFVALMFGPSPAEEAVHQLTGFKPALVFILPPRVVTHLEINLVPTRIDSQDPSGLSGHAPPGHPPSLFLDRLLCLYLPVWPLHCQYFVITQQCHYLELKPVRFWCFKARFLI